MPSLSPLTARITADTRDFDTKVKRANRDTERFTQSVQRQARAIGKTREEARLYELQIRGASRETIRAARAAVQHKEAMQRQFQGRQQMRGAVSALGGRFGVPAGGGPAIAGVAAAAVGLRMQAEAMRQLTRATVDAVKASEQFNTKMNNSLAILPNVGRALRRDMADAAFEAARSSRFAADEAAEAYFFLASAGLDAKQSIAALPQVTKFAQAGNFDLARATDLATDAQSALGLTVKDASQNLRNLTRVTDVLIAANTKANATAEQFSTALTSGAATAGRQAGKSIEEIVAVLAVFADQGVKADEAGTQFGIVLRDLQTKALQNAAAFKANNIAVFDAQGNMRDMADIVRDLEMRLDGMSTAGQKATLMQLGFSDKSVKATQTLLGFSERIRQIKQDLEAAGGTTQRVADSQLTKFQKGTEALEAEVTRLRVALGEPIADKFGDALGKIAQRLSDVQIGEDGMQAFTNRIELTAAAMEGATTAAIGYADAIASFIDANARAAGQSNTVLEFLARSGFNIGMDQSGTAPRNVDSQIAEHQRRLRQREEFRANLPTFDDYMLNMSRDMRQQAAQYANSQGVVGSAGRGLATGGNIDGLLGALMAPLVGDATGRTGGMLGAVRQGLTFTATTGGNVPSVGTLGSLQAGGLEAFRVSQAARAEASGRKPEERQVDLLGELVEGVNGIRSFIQARSGGGVGSFSLILGGEGEE